MTALLLPGETLRVGVNVIVRPGDRRCDYCVDDFGAGDRCQFGHDIHLGFTVVAPQDWVALTGPRPTDCILGHARKAMECPSCSGSDDPAWWKWYKTRTQSADVRQRIADWLNGKRDCRDGRVIEPLYTGCHSCKGTGRLPGDDIYPQVGGVGPIRLGTTIPCNGCKGTGQRLVGRGSIEVVPVSPWASHIDTPKGRWLTVTPGGWLTWQSCDGYTLTTEPAIVWCDPLPVPGRDWGIVIDCVEVAR